MRRARESDKCAVAISKLVLRGSAVGVVNLVKRGRRVGDRFYFIRELFLVCTLTVYAPANCFYTYHHVVATKNSIRKN